MKETENLYILNKGDDLPYTPDQTAEPYGNSRDRSGLYRTGTGSSEEPAGSKAFVFFLDILMELAEFIIEQAL